MPAPMSSEELEAMRARRDSGSYANAVIDRKILLNEVERLRELKCAVCGMRVAHLNHAGHVIGWGCADGDNCKDDRLVQARAAGWDEGYKSGVEDERTSADNIGIAGLGGKVSPARVNPYHPPASGMPRPPAEAAAPGESVAEFIVRTAREAAQPPASGTIAADPSTARGTGVGGPHARPEAGHWLKLDKDRRVTGCQCGFAADTDADCGWGDSVVAHLFEVAAAAARPVLYREAIDSLRAIAEHRLATAPDALAHARGLGIEDAAKILESVSKDLEGDTDAE